MTAHLENHKEAIPELSRGSISCPSGFSRLAQLLGTIIDQGKAMWIFSSNSLPWARQQVQNII